MKPINIKIAAALPLTGLLLLAASFLLKHLGINAAAEGFMAGIGCAWIALGLLGLFIKRVNPNYMKKMETNQKDERNMQLREKSGYISFLVTLFTLLLLGFVFLVTDNDIACILTIGVLTVHIASTLIALFYYNRKI